MCGIVVEINQLYFEKENMKKILERVANQIKTEVGILEFVLSPDLQVLREIFSVETILA